MDFEFRAAKEKLQREQKERKEKARAKIEHERKAKDEALRRKEAVEAEQRSRRIEAAQAALAASQQEEEDLIAGNGIRFNTILHAIPSQVEKITHSGVLEFTASDGFAELPPQVWRNLIPVNIQSPLIRVRYVRLPKGVYAKLQPDVLGFSDIPNHKAVLETTLRRHATLSEGDLLIVHHGGGLDYELRVLELRPGSSISVLETDIEVDIIEPSSTDQLHVAGAMSRHIVLTPLVLGKSETGLVEEGKYNYYKFLIDTKIADAATKGDINVLVRLQLDNDGDADLYISRHPLLFPTQHQHQWSSHDVGTKFISLTPRSLAADTYSIGVFGFKGLSKYKIMVECQLPSVRHEAMGKKLAATSSGTTSSHGFGVGGPAHSDSEQCQNCKQFIPTRTITLHEAYCRRHNIVCQYEHCGVVLRKQEAGKHVHCLKCGQAFQQEEMEKHMKVFHEPLHCKCGAILEMEEMVIHQTSACPLRVVTCRFCGDMVQVGNPADDARDRLRGFSQHESLCGSRTAPCDSCGRAIMLKEMDFHKVAVHDITTSTSENENKGSNH
eukprot:Gb_19045 [translate_table: standard]